MKISIVKKIMGKTKEETKPFAVVGPVSDDFYVLNEQGCFIFWSKTYELMYKNQWIIAGNSCDKCGYLLDYSYGNCQYCGHDYCPF